MSRRSLPPDDYEIWKSQESTPRGESASSRESLPKRKGKSVKSKASKSAYTLPPRKKEGLGCINHVFGTRQLAQEKDRETYIGVTIRELCIYIAYLIIVCILAFGTATSSTYYFTKIMTDLFIDSPLPNSGKLFRESTTIDDFWEFVQQPMIHGLYWESLYKDGVKGPNVRNTTINGIAFENKLIGAPRLRQLRVKPGSCTVAAKYRRFVRQCYAPYDRKYEDTTSPWRKLNGTAWQYFSEEKLNGSSYMGKLAWYSGAGSIVNLVVDKVPNKDASMNAAELTKAALQALKREHWITRATRAIFLDFTVYNANINLFCIVKLIWEVPATGGVYTTWKLRTVSLIQYSSWLEIWVIFPCEIIFCIFTLYYTIQEMLEICHLGCQWLSDIWSYLDFAILGFSYASIGLRAYNFVLSGRVFAALPIGTTDYVSAFEHLGFMATVYKECVAACIFIAWIKIFKYISFNKTMTQLSATLSRCAADIGGFAIMFFIVFAAFAQLGFLMFGSQVRDFSTFVESVFTLLRLILGDFNFRQIEAAHPILGPVFFIAYVFFVFFVLLNMFLAIINDTFGSKAKTYLRAQDKEEGEVKAEIQSQRNEFEIADYFKRSFNNMRGCCGKKDEQLDAQYAVKLASSDGQITYEELRKNLERADFSPVEIEMFLARYELDHNRALDEDEIQHVLAELEGNHSNRSSMVRSSHDKLLVDALQQEEIEDVQKRVAMMESSITSIMHKIDAIKNKLEKSGAITTT